MRCAAVLLLLLALAESGAAAPPKIVARVNGVSISERRVVSEMMQRLPWLRFHRRFTEELMRKLRAETLEQLIEEELLFQEARRIKLVPSAAEVEREKVAQVAAIGGERKAAQKLATWHMTWPEYWGALERKLAARAVLEKLVRAPSRPTEGEVEAEYRSGLDRFRRPPEVKLKQMLFRVRPEAPAKEWEAARARAEEVARRLKLGADFDTMRKAALQRGRSDIRAGDMGWVHQGRLVPEIDRAAFALRPGQHTDAIRTLEGFVVLKVEARREGKQLTLLEAAPGIRRALYERRSSERQQALLRGLRDAGTITRTN